MNFGETGCPIKCPLYAKPVDFSKVYCPQAEYASTSVALSIPHANFLAGTEDMDLILEAIRKVRAKRQSTEPGVEEKKDDPEQ